MARCLHHPHKWAQGQGLCRKCQREAADSLLFAETREAEQHQQIAALRRPASAWTPRTVRAEGVEYVVVWDGSASV